MANIHLGGGGVPQLHNADVTVLVPVVQSVQVATRGCFYELLSYLLIQSGSKYLQPGLWSPVTTIRVHNAK
jgi:hypothetical protein